MCHVFKIAEKGNVSHLVWFWGWEWIITNKGMVFTRKYIQGRRDKYIAHKNCSYQPQEHEKYHVWRSYQGFTKAKN